MVVQLAIVSLCVHVKLVIPVVDVQTYSFAVDPPTIDVQPSDLLSALPNTDVQFSVMTTGNSPTFQWQKDGTAIMDGADYSGTTTNTLTIMSLTNPDDEGSYNVQVTNAAGTIFSDTADLVISKLILL